MEQQLWQIPITYASSGVPSDKWSLQPKIWLKDKSLTSNIPLNETEALYVNIGAIGELIFELMLILFCNKFYSDLPTFLKITQLY